MTLNAHPGPLLARVGNTLAAWAVALLWVAPLLYLLAAALSPALISQRGQPWFTMDNLQLAWQAAPFARYLLNTFMLVSLLLASQLLVCTLAAYALARCRFVGRQLIFGLVLLQLMIMPEALIVENYRLVANLGLVDTLGGIALPYVASAFGIFLLRQTFMQVPQELEDAARVEGLGRFAILWQIYVPLARPTYLAYALVSLSYHWNNFLWPLVITNTPASRPVTVGMALFVSPETGVNWGILSAGTLVTVLPLLLAFLLGQRHFIQSFMQAGVK